MFAADADRDSLRQGDILAGIPFPLLDADTFHLLSRPKVSLGIDVNVTPSQVEHRKDPTWFVCQTCTRIAFGIVISNCCDIEPRHGKILQPTFALARLIPPPKAVQQDAIKLQSLRANKDPRNRQDPGYVNLFYIEVHPELDRRDWVVDFNQIVSIPATAFPGIMERKLLQLSDDARIRFKVKLGVSLGRLSDEEATSGHSWIPAAPSIP